MMDNIKQIREKIESFITCGNRRCSTLSERYHRHLIKYHSPHCNRTPPSNTRSMRSNRLLSSNNEENGKVTPGTHTQEIRPKIDFDVQKEIMAWAQDLPVFYNPKFEEVKENVLNELTENISILLKDENATEKILDKLKKEISESVYSIPLTYEQHKLYEKNLLQIVKQTKNSSELKINSREDNLLYRGETVSESLNKKYTDIVQNSYIDIIKNISPVLLTDFKLTSCNGINFNLQTTNSIVETKNSTNNELKILSLRVCKLQTHEENDHNKKYFEVLNKTAIISKYQNVSKCRALDIQNKLDISNINIREIVDVKGLQTISTTKISQDSLGNYFWIYRSEDRNTVNSNTLSTPTINNNVSEKAVCDVDSIKNEIFNWILEKQSLLQHNVSPNKNNRAITKVSKCLYGYMTKKEPQNFVSKEIKKWLKKFLKPEFYGDIEILCNELIDRINSLFLKTNNTLEQGLTNKETQASSCADIETVVLECSLKTMLLKYVAVLSEEESTIVKNIYRLLFKYKIQSMLDSKLCAKNYEKKEHENVLSFKLKSDLAYIEMLSYWIKNSASDTIISSLEANSEILIDIISESSTKVSNENYRRKIFYKLESALQTICEDDINKLVDKLLQIRVDRSPKKAVCKGCYDENRSDVVDNFLCIHGIDTIKQNFKLNIVLKRILKEINFCLCHLYYTQINNEFKYAKEICKWINNLPLLPATADNVQNNIVTTVANFVNVFKIEHEDYDSYITDFIVALPLKKDKEIDVQIAALQLKKRLQYANKIKYENEEESRVKEELIPKTDIVTDIQDWCQKLSLNVADEKTSVILKHRLAWNLLKKIGELNMNSEHYGKDNKMYEDDVTLEIEAQLKDSPLNYTKENTTNLLKKQLLDKCLQNFNAIENKQAPVRYVLHLRNLIELSLRSNVNIKTEEDNILLLRIRDGLLDLSLLRQFETNNDEVTKKCYTFLMEEISEYLQYARTIFIIPFLLDLNQDLLTYDIVQYQNHPFIAKLLKFIKTKTVLGNWIKTLPLQNPSGLHGVLQKYEILIEVTDLVIEIENKYDYIDSNIDNALVKCIHILSLSESLQEKLISQLKNILMSTLNERNDHTSGSKKNCNAIANQNFLEPFLNSKNSTEHISDTAKVEATQNNSKSQEHKTNNWFSLPPATTINDNTTLDDSTLNGKYDNKEQNVHKTLQNESTTVNYKDFEDGVDLKSSVIELSPNERTVHRSSGVEPIIPNYENFEKGVDYNSSLIESSPKKRESSTQHTAYFDKTKFVDASTNEQIKSSCTGAQTSHYKICSLNNIEELETNEHCVPGCKPQKSSQTSSLGVCPKKETIHEKPYRIIDEESNERSEILKQEDNNEDITCRCHSKCLPCYIRRYCKFCNQLPLRYPELHFW